MSKPALGRSLGALLHRSPSAAPPAGADAAPSPAPAPALGPGMKTLLGRPAAEGVSAPAGLPGAVRAGLVAGDVVLAGLAAFLVLGREGRPGMLETGLALAATATACWLGCLAARAER